MSTPRKQFTGEEPVSEKTVYADAVLKFMAALCPEDIEARKEERTPPKKCAQLAQDYADMYLEAINGGIYSPGDNIPDE